jgi:ATP-binding cassette subfamily B protein
VLERRLAHESVGHAWVLRLAPGAAFYHQLRCAGLTLRLGALVAAHTLQYVLWILSWWMIGRGALQGRLDTGWLLAWALMLITLVPFRLFVTWSQARIAIGTGGLLKRRLLLGALRLEPDRIRHQGVGQLLGRVIESEAVESLALSGGFLGLTAAIELVAAVVVLALGAGGGLQATLLVAWIAFTLLLGRRYFGQRSAWTEERVGLTHHLVETMVGHRTRLAQQPREQWHRGEDAGLERFMDRSRSMDRTAAWILAGAPRGWLVLGLLGLAFPFVMGRVSPEMLAVGLGGTLLAFGALERLAASVWHLTGAWIAWDGAAPVFRQAAEASEPLARTPPSARPDREPGDDPVIDAHNLVFRYRDHGRPVLRGCDLRVRRGERILLEGASGGGKSTLASLLAGLRDPESGLVLLGGLDRATLGARRWVRGVAAAPQFHENHVLTETFAFNLLMGRRWPPTQADFEEAEEICHELGLGPLLERMPAGLLQMVGETGWQLSHGEKSRLYIARALLQNSDLLILDESFAALDPENLHRCVRSVLNRAPTLLVIAHP